MMDAITGIENLKPGSHLCAIVETPEEHLALVSQFIVQGVGRNHTVIHIDTGKNRYEILRRLKTDGLDASPCMGTGQLAFFTTDEIFSPDGRFDPGGIIARLKRETRRAEGEGFGAPWVSIEMTGVSLETPESAFLIECESVLNRFFTGSRCIGLCLYDRQRFPASVLLDVLRCHPFLLLNAEPHENIYYIPPENLRSPAADRALLNRRIEVLKILKSQKKLPAAAKVLKEEAGDVWQNCLLETVLESIPIPVFYKDRNGIYRGCNAAFAEYLGLPMDRIIGKTVYDVAPKKNADIYKKADDEMFRHPGVQRYEAEVRFPDGSNRDVFFTKATWMEKDGLVGGLVGVIVDLTERKQALDQLEQARDGFRHVVDHFPDAIMIISSDRQIRHINRAAEAMFQIRAGSMIGKDFGHSTEVINGAEAKFVGFGGAMRLVEALSFETVWEGKKSDLVLLRDIAERKKTEDSLRRNETRLNAFYELYRKEFETEKELVEFALEEAIRFTDSRIGYFHFVNKAQTHIDMFTWSGEIREGCRLEFEAHRPISETGRWADSVRLKRPVIHNDYPKMAMRRGYPAGHPEIQRHMSVPVLMDDRVVGIAGVANKENPYDDQDARQVELFMQGMWSILLRRRDADERRRLYTAIDQSPNIVMITDAQGRIQFVNTAFSEITGYSKREALGENPRILKSGRHDDAFYRDLWKTIADGRIWRGNLINKTRKGDLFEADVAISPVKNRDGGIVAYVCIMEDITEEKKKEEQLRHSQKMEAIGQLAGGVAHDFNNMLQVIFGSVEFVLEQTGPGSELFEDLEEIRKASERASELTRQLLAFGRRQVLLPVRMDLNDTVTDWLKMLRRVIPENIGIKFIPGHQLGTVLADAVQINQVLMNICINARDAMHEGGQIVIENQNVVFDDTYCREHPWAKPGRYVLMSISDTGCGIPSEHLPFIFDPFFTTKGVGQGTGMGLAMVHGAITQHNGLVHVYSEPGKGTTFKIYLPVVEQMAGEVGKQIQGPARGGAETLLVVEDDPQVRKMIRRILQSAGYRVILAENGGEAVSILENQGQEIHMAILDVVMPEMGGREVYDRIRKGWPHIRTIFSSGYTNNSIHTGFILEDGLILLPKPYNKEDLLRKVREVLDAGTGEG